MAVIIALELRKNKNQTNNKKKKLLRQLLAKIFVGITQKFAGKNVTHRHFGDYRCVMTLTKIYQHRLEKENGRLRMGQRVHWNFNKSNYSD